MNNSTISETFFSALENILTENGIDDTLTLLPPNKAKFECNDHTVTVGINTAESFIFYFAYTNLNKKSTPVLSIRYKTGNEDEFVSITEQILEKISNKKLTETTDNNMPFNFGRVCDSNDFGKSLGTSAQKIYDEYCEKYGFDRKKRYHFGKRQLLYAEDATPEGYSVWFLPHSPLIEKFEDCETTWYNIPYFNGYIEECWRVDRIASSGITNCNDTRVTFFKTKYGYAFAGIYIPVGTITTRVINGTKVLIRTFYKVSDTYPENF